MISFEAILTLSDTTYRVRLMDRNGDLCWAVKDIFPEHISVEDLCKRTSLPFVDYKLPIKEALEKARYF
jgi:hypothetical protein